MADKDGDQSEKNKQEIDLEEQLCNPQAKNWADDEQLPEIAAQVNGIKGHIRIIIENIQQLQLIDIYNTVGDLLIT